MIGHGEPRATALSVIKGPPAVSKVDVVLLHGLAAGLRGGAATKGATEAVFVINLDIWGNKIWMLLLNEMKMVQYV